MTTNTTISQYDKINQSLIRKAAKRYRTTKITPDQVVGALIASKNAIPNEMTMATFRLYKSALLHYLRTNNQTHLAAYSQLIEASSAGLPKKSSRTSGKKVKYITHEDHLALANFLLMHEHKWQLSRELADLLEAGFLTGVRPVEWRNTKLTDKQLTAPNDATHTLIVKNAKATNGRGNGNSREMHLVLNTTQAAAIAHTATNMGNLTNKSYAEKYKQLRDLMRRAVRLLWPKRAKYPSIYTNRHQFRANAVSGGATPVETAALMGHASDQTAPRNYGRRGGDKKLLLARADEVSLANVRNTALSERLGLMPAKETTTPTIITDPASNADELKK